jgi:hypothetical protein
MRQKGEVGLGLVKHTADTTSMVVHVRTRWLATLVLVALGVSALIRLHFGVTGLALAALAVVPVVVVHRMRLTADDSGVTIVNLLVRRRLPWTEIGDFRLGRVGLSACLDVCRRDGSRVHAWAVTTGGVAAYSAGEIARILTDLRERLVLATGESKEDIDARAIDEALAAAERGAYSQASSLVAENRIAAEAMAEKLVERSRQSKR